MTVQVVIMTAICLASQLIGLAARPAGSRDGTICIPPPCRAWMESLHDALHGRSQPLQGGLRPPARASRPPGPVVGNPPYDGLSKCLSMILGGRAFWRAAAPSGSDGAERKYVDHGYHGYHGSEKIDQVIDGPGARSSCTGEWSG